MSFSQPISNNFNSFISNEPYLEKLSNTNKKLTTEYIKENDFTAAIALLKKIDPKEIEKDYSILTVAVRAGNEEFIRALLELGFRPDVLNPTEIIAPLIQAVVSNAYNIAQILIDKHIQNLSSHAKFTPTLLSMESFIDTSDMSYMTPLMIACLGNNVQWVQLFLSYGANINRQEKAGNTPLHLCLQSSNYENILPLLLSLDEVKPDLENFSHETPLIRAILLKNYKAIEILASSEKVNINALTNIGVLPLNIAVETRTPACVEIMLNHGADVSLADVGNCNPVFLAKSYIQQEILKIFKTRTPHAHALNGEIFRRKMLAHVADVGGISEFRKKSDPSLLIKEDLYGLHAPYIHEFIHKRTNEFLNYTSGPHSAIIKHLSLTSQFAAASGNLYIRPDQPGYATRLFDEWKLGNPVYIQASVTEHTMELFAWDNEIFWCNRWADANDSSRSHYRAFSFDKSLFTENTISQILNPHTTAKNKIYFLEEMLPELLKGKKELFHTVLENYSIHPQKPKIGNCSWVNIQGLQLPHSVLFEMKQLQKQKSDFTEAEIQALIDKNAILCDNLFSYYQFYTVRKAVNCILDKSSTFLPAFDLVSHVFTACYPYSEFNTEPHLVRMWKNLEKSMIRHIPSKYLDTFYFQKKQMQAINYRLIQIDELLTQIKDRSLKRRIDQFGAPPAKRRKTEPLFS